MTTAHRYHLGHTNVDGYGPVSDHDTLDEAIQEADRLQAATDAHGNRWGYRYHVSYGRAGIIYRTTPNPQRATA